MYPAYSSSAPAATSAGTSDDRSAGERISTVSPPRLAGQPRPGHAGHLPGYPPPRATDLRVLEHPRAPRTEDDPPPGSRCASAGRVEQDRFSRDPADQEPPANLDVVPGPRLDEDLRPRIHRHRDPLPDEHGPREADHPLPRCRHGDVPAVEARVGMRTRRPRQRQGHRDPENSAEGRSPVRHVPYPPSPGGAMRNGSKRTRPRSASAPRSKIRARIAAGSVVPHQLPPAGISALWRFPSLKS